MKFARNAMHIALSQMFVGLVSYFTVFVGARILDAENLARFSTSWAVVNTVALTALIPTETYSPKLRGEFEKSNINSNSDVESTLLLYCLLSGMLSMAISAILALIDVLPVTFSEFIAITVFVCGATGYGFKRATSMSLGDFRTYWKLSVNYSLVGCLGLFVILLVNQDDWTALFVLLGFAGLSTLVVPVSGQKLGTFTRFEIGRVFHQSRIMGSNRAIGNLLIATFLSLLLSNGAVAFGLRVGVNPRDLVAYSGMLNIVLIPLTLLNSFSAPILTKAVSLFHSHQKQKFSLLYLKATSLYLGAAALVVIVSVGFGNPLLHFYLGTTYDVSPRLAGAIALSQGLATLGVLPRLFLVASGATTSILRIWLIGLFCFMGILATPVNPLTRIVIAPGIAGGVIVLLSSIVLFKNIKADSSFAISPTGDTSV